MDLYRANVTEPAKYNHIGAVTPNAVMPCKPSLLSGTRWTINFVNLVLGGIRTDHYRFTRICGGDVTENSYSTDESLEFTEHLTSDVLTMFNGDDGPVFRYDVDTVFDVHDIAVPYPLHLVDHLKVERMAGCHDAPSPIHRQPVDLRFVNLNLQARTRRRTSRRLCRQGSPARGSRWKTRRSQWN